MNPFRSARFPADSTLSSVERGLFRGGGAEVFTSLEAAYTRAEREAKDRVFILGGAEIYRLALAQIDEMVLTHIPEEIDGDAFFPSWERTEWNRVECRSEDKLTFATYRRR